MNAGCRAGGDQAIRAAGTSSSSASPTSTGRTLGGRPRLRFWATTLPLHEQLAAPHAPRLAPGQGAVQAVVPDRARLAEGLGGGDVVELLGEEEVEERAGAVVAQGVVPPHLLDLLVSEHGASFRNERWRTPKRERPPGLPGGLVESCGAVAARATTLRVTGPGTASERRTAGYRFPWRPSRRHGSR